MGPSFRHSFSRQPSLINLQAGGLLIEAPLKLSKNITIGPAPDEACLESLSAKGFKSVVNFSKKGELDQKMLPVDEGALVESLGMEYLHVPLSVSNLKHDVVDSFVEQSESLEEPIYMHCRAGQRSTPFALLLYAIRRKLSVEATFKFAENKGVRWDAPFLRHFVETYLTRKNRSE
jgi:uncharacterized protein (TIGR01244 family)